MGPPTTPHRNPPTDQTHLRTARMGGPSTHTMRAATLSTVLVTAGAGSTQASSASSTDSATAATVDAGSVLAEKLVMLGEEVGRIMICMECAEGLWG